MIIPAGYSESSALEIRPPEVARLFSHSPWADNPISMADVHPESEPGRENQSIGIRNSNGVLIGYGGLTMYLDRDEAEMHSLIVRPDHRHQGLARFLVARRVEIADMVEIKRLQMDDLLKTNSLRLFYYELGFVFDPYGGVLIREKKRV